MRYLGLFLAGLALGVAVSFIEKAGGTHELNQEHPCVACDVNHNGYVTIQDALIILDHVGAVFPTRDKMKWPFASTSPWNMPIGNGAVFVPAGLQTEGQITVDTDYIYTSGTGRALYLNGTWPAQCNGATFYTNVLIPDGALIPTGPGTPNNPFASVLADGRTIIQANPAARCSGTGPVYAGWAAPTVDIYGQGLPGGHGGSGLSSIGGALRLGELTSTNSIRHALKVNVECSQYCSPTNNGYRWPAFHADSYWASVYGGSIPAMRMGSLLALPPSVDIVTMGLQTAPGRKLAWTLQNYGAYVVDDTGWDVYALDAEQGVDSEFQSFYGFSMWASSGPWYDDVMLIFRSLSVVDNNTVDTAGGGGRTREPLAPAFSN